MDEENATIKNFLPSPSLFRLHGRPFLSLGYLSVHAIAFIKASVGDSDGNKAKDEKKKTTPQPTVCFVMERERENTLGKRCDADGSDGC